MLKDILLTRRKPAIIWDSYLQLYLPLYHADLKGSPIVSFDQNHHSCTVTEAVWGSQGRTFDGSNDQIAIPNSASLRLTTGLTAIAWVKPDTRTAEDAIMGLLNDSGVNRRAWMLQRSTVDTFRFYCSSDGTHTNSASIDTTSTAVEGVWQMVSICYSPSAWSIYYNTTAEASGDPSVNSIYVNSTDTFEIGDVASNNRFYHGTIGECLLYNRYFTAAEIGRIYNATKWRYR